MLLLEFIIPILLLMKVYFRTLHRGSLIVNLILQKKCDGYLYYVWYCCDSITVMNTQAKET